jgi:hypothetical protein
MLQYLTNLGEHLSNCLAIFKALGTTPGGGCISGVHRRLLSSNKDDVSFPPRWVKHSDRRLLVPAAADMVVAKDGSGTHLSISDAVERGGAGVQPPPSCDLRQGRCVHRERQDRAREDET